MSQRRTSNRGRPLGRLWDGWIRPAIEPHACSHCSPRRKAKLPYYANDPRFRRVRAVQMGLGYLAVGCWFGFCALALYWGRTLPTHPIPAEGRLFAFHDHGIIFLTARERLMRDGLIGGFFAVLVSALALELWLHRLFPPER